MSYAKTDQRYWREKVAKRNRGDGADASYSVQIQYSGKRSRFPLNTANKSAAAEKAAKIYKDLLAHGWDATLKIHNPNRRRLSQRVEGNTFIDRPTIGDVIEQATFISTARPSTLNGYVKALRKIVSDIRGIPKAGKYDGRSGGSKTWQERIDATLLDELTTDKIIQWKNSFLKVENDGAPKALRSRTNTCNTLLRCAKALFAKKTRRLLADRMRLPDRIPFDEVPMAKPPSSRYQSKIDAKKLMKAAREELAPEQPEEYKIFLLALVCGLRRSEIDKLLWVAFDFEKRVLRIENTQYHALKSEDSAGEIDLGEDMVAYFRSQYDVAKSEFVIASPNRPRTPNSGTRHYRCTLHFGNLGEWLRTQGGNVQKPIHELRKEAGSLIAAEYGIFEASRFLRHSDIRITSSTYLDKKRRVTPSLSLE